MRLRAISPSVALFAAVLAAGCKEQSPISHAPTSIQVVSGSNQSANVSTALDSALVVKVVDGANKAVAGVNLTWTVIGGGSLSSTTTTTGNDGTSSVKWTLAPTAGNQVVTVTSGQISGAQASFVASNGATISGTVTSSGTLPFATNFSRVSHSSALTANRAVTRHPSPNRIIVGFKGEALGIAAAGSMAYRSLSAARSAMTVMRQRSANLVAAHPLISNAELSPAIVAARYRVKDTLQIEAVMASLRNDPNVSYVERDEIVSVRDGAPHPMSADLVRGVSLSPTSGLNSVATKLPNDPAYFEQAWPSNMVDLPRAWAITTGSPSVTVAVVDMGIRFDHPDIKANLTSDGYDFVSQVGFGTTEQICATQTTPASTFTTIDGDGDGPDADPTDPDDLEFDSIDGCWVHNTLGDHGLWTAGIIGAVGNEGVGISGINWNVKIRPIRVLGITGDGTNFDIAQGILYAAGLAAVGKDSAVVQTSRAPIINMSLGGTGASTTLANAVAAAQNAGSLVIASAGNDGLDGLTYPAALPGVIGVAAVGMDGQLATYSNAGSFISLAAPGGDFRLDDNGGGGVLGPGWNFQTGKATYLFGYGTSASAPYVSGIAALLLAQTPSLTAAQLTSRLEQYATRTSSSTRSDMFGYGIVNAYNALAQQNGPSRSTIARLIDATTGAASRTTPVDVNGNFVFTKVANGSYNLQVGDDESGDGVLGTPGRRLAWAGGFGKPTTFVVNNNSSSAAILLGSPTEVEPNDDTGHANILSVNSYVLGNITPPDARDVYAVMIPAAGSYTFETSGVLGTCGLGIELDTFISVSSAAGAVTGTSDNVTSASGRFCSRLTATLAPGTYFITVTPSSSAAKNFTADHGRYRLEVRAGS